MQNQETVLPHNIFFAAATFTPSNPLIACNPVVAEGCTTVQDEGKISGFAQEIGSRRTADRVCRWTREVGKTGETIISPDELI